MQSFKIRQKLDLSRVCFRGHSHIESFHRLREIDLSRWVGLALWSQNLTHEISIFVKIQFNFKKKNISLKTNLKTLLILPKTKNLYWLHHVTLKTNLSNTHLEKSVETNFFKRFKVIASLPMLTPYLRIFSKKKGFLRKCSKPGQSSSNYFNCSSWTFKVELKLWWYKNLFSSSFKGLLANVVKLEPTPSS